jgi:hypothetical protein
VVLVCRQVFSGTPFSNLLTVGINKRHFEASHKGSSNIFKFVAAAGDFLCEVMKSLISRGHPRKTKKIGGPRHRAFGAAPSGPPRDVTLRYVTVRYGTLCTLRNDMYVKISNVREVRVS